MSLSDRDRVGRCLDDLADTLELAASLVDRGRAAYDGDTALRLAFEALANRVGDLAKRLSAADPDRFGDPIWSLAARNRDVIVHHYDRIDDALLWQTVAAGFPQLRDVLDRSRGS